MSDWFDILDRAESGPLAGGDHDAVKFEHLVAGGTLLMAVWALQYEPLISLSIIAAEVGLFAYLVLRRRLRRRTRDGDHASRIAKAAGLRLAAPGEFDLYSLPFPIFRAGEWQGFDHVFVGDWDGDRVWIFDSWNGYELRGQDVEDHFTCAAMEIRADCPKLSITRENAWSRTWGHLGWRDIELESEDFNRRFDVSGDDARFAFAFLAPAVIEWLQETPSAFEFAVQGKWLLCRSKHIPTERWWEMLRMIREFRGRVPVSLTRLWPEVGAVR